MQTVSPIWELDTLTLSVYVCVCVFVCMYSMADYLISGGTGT